MIYPLDLNMWLAMALELVLLAALMGGIAFYQRWHPLSPETSRKLFHISGGLTTLTFPWLFTSAWPIILLALITIPSLLALKYIRTFKGNIALHANERTARTPCGPMSEASRESGVSGLLARAARATFLHEYGYNLASVLYRIDRRSFGEIYFPFSVCLLFVISGHHSLLFTIPVLILTLADPAAALIGARYGRLRYPTIRGQKSIEGSAAFFLVAFFCACIPLLLFSATSLAEAMFISLLVGLLVMLAEAVSWDGLDNLVIPIFSYFLLLMLLPLSAQFLWLDLTMVLSLITLLYLLIWLHPAPKEENLC